MWLIKNSDYVQKVSAFSYFYCFNYDPAKTFNSSGLAFQYYFLKEAFDIILYTNNLSTFFHDKGSLYLFQNQLLITFILKDR